MQVIKMIRNRLFRQRVITEVSRHVYALSAEKKSRLANLDIETWGMEISGTSHGVKSVDKRLLLGDMEKGKQNG